MAHLRYVPCLTKGCTEWAVAGTGRCTYHRPAWAGSTRSERLPKDWASRRSTVLARDKKKCYLCGLPATEVDHIIAGDNHRLENLAAICNYCHKIKTQTESADARWGKNRKTKR